MADLDADEKQHVLSYQVAYLLQTLTEQTASMQVVDEQQQAAKHKSTGALTAA